MNEWLKRLKVGDQVIVKNTWLEFLATVAGVTRSQISVDCGPQKYRIKDGLKSGSKDWHGEYILEATEERTKVAAKPIKKEYIG